MKVLSEIRMNLGAETKMDSNPLVSIIINNYNYGAFVGNAIESAIAQTYPNVEIIVVDDGSTDNSSSVIQKYVDVVKFVAKQNGGQASAFNAGFSVSSGEIICFLDSDDYFLPSKAEKVVSCFDQYPDIDWSFHPLPLVNEANCILESNQSFVSAKHDYRKLIQSGGIPFIPTATSGLCFRRSLLEKILPMPEEIKITSDNYIKFIAMAEGKAFLIADKLAVQTIHGSNAYTLNPRKRILQAEIGILTAYWILVRFPHLGRMADRLFAEEATIASHQAQTDIALASVIHSYLSLKTPIQRFQIKLRVFYKLGRANLKGAFRGNR